VEDEHRGEDGDVDQDGDGALIRQALQCPIMRLPEKLSDDWKDALAAILMEYHAVLAAHPNMMPLAGMRLDDETDSGLMYLIEDQGFDLDDAVGLWQSLISFVVGFSTFASQYAEASTRGLPAEVGARGGLADGNGREDAACDHGGIRAGARCAMPRTPVGAPHTGAPTVLQLDGPPAQRAVVRDATTSATCP
jgi:hypothetical protein